MFLWWSWPLCHCSSSYILHKNIPVFIGHYFFLWHVSFPFMRTVLTNKNILPGRVRQSNISPNVFPHSSRPDNRQISAGPQCQWHSNGDSINSIHSRLTWRLSLICSRLFLSHSCSSPGFFVLRTNSDIHFYCWYLVNLRFSFPLASSVINLSVTACHQYYYQ